MPEISFSDPGERSTYITQDMIDALFAGEKIPLAVEDGTYLDRLPLDDAISKTFFH